MGSPEAAVEELLASVRASDPLGLLAVLHPDERYLVDTLYSNTTSSAEASGAVDVDALLRALYIDVTTAPFAVEPLNERVAWVTTTSAEVTARLDVEQLDAAVAADLSDWEPVEDFEETLEPQNDQFGIAVVNEGGQWFVSVLYTAAELARRGMELPPQLAAAPAPAGATSPEAAITAFAAAVSSQDLQGVASTLTPFEGRLVADYEATVGEELVEGLEGYTFTVEPTHLKVIEHSTDWAIVEVDAWKFGLTGVDEDGDRVDFSLSVDGLCGEVRDWDGYDEKYDQSKGCAFEDDSIVNVFSILADTGWRGPRFVVVNQGGSWSVSLLQSVLQTTAPFTTDVVTFTGVVEFLLNAFSSVDDDFYAAAMSFLASGKPPLAPGTSTVPTSGHGRVALFRVESGVTVGVDVAAGDHEDCFVAVVDIELGDFSGSFECFEESEPILSDSILLVTTSNDTAFSSIHQLGDVTVTVTPA